MLACNLFCVEKASVNSRGSCQALKRNSKGRETIEVATLL